MGLRIYNNVEALNAHRVLNNTNAQIRRAMERLSSGLWINRAADAAAGLAVSEVMRSQIRGMQVASSTTLDGVSMVQVADGALGNVGDMLQRVSDLSVQASNGTLTDAQRTNLDPPPSPFRSAPTPARPSPRSARPTSASTASPSRRRPRPAPPSPRWTPPSAPSPPTGRPWA